jgi:hypothetical protein
VAQRDDAVGEIRQYQVEHHRDDLHPGECGYRQIGQQGDQVQIRDVVVRKVVLEGAESTVRGNELVPVFDEELVVGGLVVEHGNPGRDRGHDRCRGHQSHSAEFSLPVLVDVDGFRCCGHAATVDRVCES